MSVYIFSIVIIGSFLSLSGKGKLKAGAVDLATAATPADDFDALIDAVVKAESVCGFAKCKTSVLTLAHLCVYCNRQYCLSHHIPEVTPRTTVNKH